MLGSLPSPATESLHSSGQVQMQSDKGDIIFPCNDSHSHEVGDQLLLTPSPPTAPAVHLIVL